MYCFFVLLQVPTHSLLFCRVLRLTTTKASTHPANSQLSTSKASDARKKVTYQENILYAPDRRDHPVSSLEPVPDHRCYLFPPPPLDHSRAELAKLARPAWPFRWRRNRVHRRTGYWRRNKFLSSPFTHCGRSHSTCEKRKEESSTPEKGCCALEYTQGMRNF